MHQRTRKLMTMHMALHLWDDVDRLYVPRKEGGSGLTSIQDRVDISIQRLEDFIKKREGRLITATRNNTDNTNINKIKITRKQKWEEKQLSGRQTIEISREKTWTRLRKRNLKRETKSLLIAAQKNVIRTNYVKARIDKTQQNNWCRLCGDRDETINRIRSESSKLAEKVYKTGHDWMGKVIQGELRKKFKFDHANKWYMHNPESFLENEMHKILWAFELQMDHLISARRLDLVIINNKKKKKKKKEKKKRTCRIVDFVVPADKRVKLKESEKRVKFIDLARELKQLWNNVTGVVDTVTKRLVQGLEDLEIRGRVKTIQIRVLLRSTRILRGVLETWGGLQMLRLQWKTIS